MPHAIVLGEPWCLSRGQDGGKQRALPGESRTFESASLTLFGKEESMTRERHCDSCGKSMGVMSDESWSQYRTRGGHKCSSCYRRTNPEEAEKELTLFPEIRRSYQE